MTQALATVRHEPLAATIENVLINGDLSQLEPDQRLHYYKAVCESVGLNPLTKPFDYLRLNGKLVLYAKRDATDQLRKIHGVSIVSVTSQRLEDVFVVTANAKDRDGRTDSSTGAVTVGNLKGDNLANALMKAETKAKRRVTLSICGLGLLDETELETIKDAQVPPPVVGVAQGGIPTDAVAEQSPAPPPSPTLTGVIEQIRGSERGWWFELSGGLTLYAPSQFNSEALRGRKGFEVVVRGMEKTTKTGKRYYQLTEICDVAEPKILQSEPEPLFKADDSDVPF